MITEEQLQAWESDGAVGVDRQARLIAEVRRLRRGYDGLRDAIRWTREAGVTLTETARLHGEVERLQQHSAMLEPCDCGTHYKAAP